MGVSAFDALWVAVWGILYNDTTLRTIMSGEEEDPPAPRVYGVWAPTDSPMPYITRRLELRTDSETPGMADGALWIDVWTYGTSSAQASEAGGRIIDLLDGELLDAGEGEVRACRVEFDTASFGDTESDTVHRWISAWTLRLVRQGEMSRR